MSDMDSSSGSSNQPPSGWSPPASAPQQGGWQQQPGGWQQQGQSPGYGGGWGAPAPYMAAKPPRPKAMLGGGILLAAAALVLLACFLPWVSGHGDSLNGFDNYYCVDDDCVGSKDTQDLESLSSDTVELESPAVFPLLGAILLAAFAITLLAAGRITAIAILALIASAIGVIVAIVFFYVMTQVTNSADGVSLGVGIFAQLLGALGAVAGSIVALAQKGTPRQPAYGQPAHYGGYPS